MVETETTKSGKPQPANMAAYIVGGGLFILFIVTLGLSLTGPTVGNVFSNIASSMIIPTASTGVGTAGMEPLSPQAPSRVILREGHLTLVVEDTHATTKAIKAIVGEVEKEGAFIVSSEEVVKTESQVLAANMTIRVPAARFDEIMERLAALAVRIEERRETAEDLTEEYVDLQGRLASMEAARDRLRRFMGEANRVEELLLVERQLAEREAEMESLMGRLEYLAGSARLSRVNISLRPSVLSNQVKALWQPGETAKRAFAGLVRSLQSAVDILIYFGIGLLPWLVAGGLVAYGISRVARRFHPTRSVEERIESPSGGKSG
jgi:hypothetical protein